MITVTLIRHGESEDNLKGIWAGWKDAPLSALGERQADALGSAFNTSSSHFQYFYASDLRRAHSTALAVVKHHAEPKPPLKVTEKLREQYFGVAEGARWAPRPPSGDKTLEEWYKEGIFPEIRSRDGKFPEGESLNDVARRAEAVVKECILPHVFDKNQDGVHIGLASHGICLSETISALMRLDPEADLSKSYKGHWNTAWSRITISIKNGYEGPYDPSSPPPLQICLLTFNNYKHLNSLPSASTSENEAAREYFSGAEVNI